MSFNVTALIVSFDAAAPMMSCHIPVRVHMCNSGSHVQSSSSSSTAPRVLLYSHSPRHPPRQHVMRARAAGTPQAMAIQSPAAGPPASAAPAARHVPAGTPIFHVLQGEVATIHDLAALPSPPPLVVSTAATTCLIIALFLPPSSLLLAHVDCPAALHDLFARLAALAPAPPSARQPSSPPPPPQPVSAWILGASPPDADASRHLLAALPVALASAPPHVPVTVCGRWVGGANTRADGAPQHTALAFDTHARAATPARVDEPAAAAPHAPRRAAARAGTAGGALQEVHDGGGGLRLRPFRVAADATQRAWLHRLLALPDTDLLRVASTSPDCEEIGFVDGVRASARWVLEREDGELVPELWC